MRKPRSTKPDGCKHPPVDQRPHLARSRISWKYAILLALLSTGAFVVSVGEDNRAAFADVLRDPLSILAQRSPGQRGSALLQTKRARTRVATSSVPFAPNERVLPVVRMRPLALLGPDTLSLSPIVPKIEEPFFLVPEVPIGGITGSGPPRFDFVNGPLPSIGGGDLPPVNRIEPPMPSEAGPEPAPAPAPVPEPETWLTMILGFLTVGGALRRRRTHATREGQGEQRLAG